MTRLLIETFSDGSFQESALGREAEVIQVVERTGEAIDLVAWFDDQPCSWWTHRLIGQVLGDRALQSAYWLEVPVRLYETPAGWTASRDSNGVCIIDWESDPRRLLNAAPLVFCESERLHDRLIDSIWLKSRPRFDLEVGFDVPRAA